MAISADSAAMPDFASASFTFSRASGGVTMYQLEPSSFISSAPASSTRSSILSSLAASFATLISPLAEHPAHRSSLSKVATVLAHHVAEFADYAIAIGGHHLNQHSDAAGTVAFKGGFFVLLAFELTRAAQDRAFHVIVGHVCALSR